LYRLLKKQESAYKNRRNIQREQSIIKTERKDTTFI